MITQNRFEESSNKLTYGIQKELSSKSGQTTPVDHLVKSWILSLFNCLPYVNL
jgi:hypothetical protein